MSLTRRRFLQHGGLMAASTWLAPWTRHPLLRAAMAAPSNPKILLIVYLEGGNDGLNTVIPLENGSRSNLRTAYELARTSGIGGLRIAASELSEMLIAPDPQTQTGLALHPAFVGLKHLYDRRQVAIVQGCGAPEFSLSHEVARRVWQFGDPLDRRVLTSGWIGRYLADTYDTNDIPALSVEQSVAAELTQARTNVVAIDNLNNFHFPYDSLYPNDESRRRAAFLALQEQARLGGPATMRFVGNTGASALLASERYPPLSTTYADERGFFDAQYSATGSLFARRLREIAAVLYGIERGLADVDVRIFAIPNYGYDTHSDQGATGSNSQHAKLLQQVGDALEIFADDCRDMGIWDQVCILVYSEFGRRVEQNANGTDHGSQAPIFVIGGQVQGGVYGNHPDINRDALDEDGNTVYSQASDDPFRSTDFRDVYGTLLHKWLGVADPTAILPVDSGPPETNWTQPNFNLPFLA